MTIYTCYTVEWVIELDKRDEGHITDTDTNTDIGGRRPVVEDDIRWKVTFNGGQLSVEDDPCMLPSPLCGIFIV